MAPKSAKYFSGHFVNQFPKAQTLNPADPQNQYDQSQPPERSEIDSSIDIDIPRVTDRTEKLV
jgi:hypothetical protein